MSEGADDAAFGVTLIKSDGRSFGVHMKKKFQIGQYGQVDKLYNPDEERPLRCDGMGWFIWPQDMHPSYAAWNGCLDGPYPDEATAKAKAEEHAEALQQFATECELVPMSGKFWRRRDWLEMDPNKLIEPPPTRDVVIDYTNHRGERRERRIMPLDRPPQWENNEFHRETQWVLYAIDLEKGAERGFAMKNIHSWRPAPAA